MYYNPTIFKRYLVTKKQKQKERHKLKIIKDEDKVQVIR